MFSRNADLTISRLLQGFPEKDNTFATNVMDTLKSSTYWITCRKGEISLIIRAKPMRSTRYIYIISNPQLSHEVFPPFEMARVTGRHPHHVWRKFSSTGTNNNVGSTINLVRHLVHTYYARTLREHRLMAQSECHRSGWIRNTSRHLS